MSQKQIEHSRSYNHHIDDNQNEEYGSLFNNSMVNAALEALSPDEIKKYQEIGNDLYGTTDFVGVQEGRIPDGVPEEAKDAVAYIECQLNSGLHPSDMDSNEKDLMASAYGDEWYTKWDYTKLDLMEI